MSDTEVKVIINGQAAGAIAAMQAAAASVREGALHMKESLATVNEGFAGIIESFGAFAAILAGGEAFKEIINQTKEWEGSAIRLARTLGTTTEAASGFMVAIEDVGGGADDFATASRGLTRQLKTNEKGLNDMGIATRDANGQLLDGTTLLFNAIDAVNSYAAGTDRNLAAQTAFGRGANANSAVLRLTKEGMEEANVTAKEMGLIVGQENVQAFTENRKATATAMDVFKGLGKAIGDALLPVLTELANWFAFVGPAAIGVTKGIIGLLVTSFWELNLAGKTVGAILAATFATVGDVLEQLFQAVGLAIQGKMGAAGQALKDIGSKVHTDWKVAFDEIADDAKNTATKIHNLFSEQTATKPAAEGNAFDLKPKEKHGPDNRLALYKNALEEMSQATGDFDKKDIAADLQFWQSIYDNTVGGTEKDIALRAAVYKEILALKKKQHDDEIKEEEEYQKTVEALQLGELAAQSEALKQAYAMGQITRQQEVAGEIDLENQKYAIQKKALDDKIALMSKDALAQQKFKDQELLLEQKHTADVQKINNKAALDEQKTWSSLFSSMQSGFSQTIQGFMKGTTSLGGAIKGLFSDIGSSIVQMLADMAAKYLATSLMQILTSKTSGIAIIGTLAAQAAAGAFAATAAIPYVGPELAPAAAALAYTDTMAFTGLASAAGGFDIPAGMNPITQLHASEMVLPAKYANVIRGMDSSGGGMKVNISAVDARSLHKALTAGGSSGPLATSIRSLGKRFAR